MSNKYPGYNKKQRNLLLVSHTIKTDFPSFYQFMQEYKKVPKRLTAEQEKDKSLTLILSRTDRTLDTIFDTARLEWDLLIKNYIPVCKDDPKREKSCELCGHPKLRYQYTIVNRYNNQQMIIGSECVTEYRLGWENPEIKSNIEDQIKELRRMNLATQEMNNLTNNGIIRINFSMRAWQRLPYLPFPKTTKEIIDIADRVPGLLKKINNSTLPHKPDVVAECESIAIRFENLLQKARQERSNDTIDWRVSNAVYQWVLERDNKSQNDKLLPSILKTCQITPENVAYIMEEGHKRECMQRLSKAMPAEVRMTYIPEQTNKIKIYLRDNLLEYPFWVTYGALLNCSVKHGFLKSTILSPFTRQDFIEMGATLDRYDGNVGTTTLYELIRDAGGSVQDENERGDRFLIRLNQNGVILDVDIIARFLSSAILSGDRTEAMAKLKYLFYGKKPMSYHNVLQNWNELYARKSR